MARAFSADLSFFGVANAPEARRGLSYSALSSFRRCQKSFEWKYVRGLEPVKREAYFRVGSLWHAGLEALYSGKDPLEALRLYGQKESEKDPEAAGTIAHEVLVYSAMMRAYLAHREKLSPADGSFRPLAAEQKFRLPLRHPANGVRSRWYDLIGVIDGVVEDDAGWVWLLEHKTTGENLETFMQRTGTDLQLTIYLNAAAELYGADRVRGAIYNVVRKPALRPMKDALVPSGKFSKEGVEKRERAGRPETSEEFAARVEADALENPTSYFARERVYRNAVSLENVKAEVWQTAQDIRGREFFLRNYDECARCAFSSICHEPNPLAESTLFRVREERIVPDDATPKQADLFAA